MSKKTHGFHLEEEVIQRLKWFAADSKLTASAIITSLINKAYEQKEVGQKQKSLNEELTYLTQEIIQHKAKILQYEMKIKEIEEEIKKCEQYQSLRVAHNEEKRNEKIQILARMIYRRKTKNEYSLEEIEQKAKTIALELGGELVEDLLEEAHNTKLVYTPM